MKIASGRFSPDTRSLDAPSDMLARIAKWLAALGGVRVLIQAGALAYLVGREGLVLADWAQSVAVVLMVGVALIMYGPRGVTAA